MDFELSMLTTLTKVGIATGLVCIPSLFAFKNGYESGVRHGAFFVANQRPPLRLEIRRADVIRWTLFWWLPSRTLVVVGTLLVCSSIATLFGGG